MWNIWWKNWMPHVLPCTAMKFFAATKRRTVCATTLVPRLNKREVGNLLDTIVYSMRQVDLHCTGTESLSLIKILLICHRWNSTDALQKERTGSGSAVLLKSYSSNCLVWRDVYKEQPIYFENEWPSSTKRWVLFIQLVEPYNLCTTR